MKKETLLWIAIVLNMIGLVLKIWGLILSRQEDDEDDELPIKCEE